jgi:hypothetical protein
MDLLPEEIRKNTYLYKFYKRGERTMMYEQIEPSTGQTVGFEIFKRKIDKPKVVFGIQLNEREIFPGNEDFGKWAWSITDEGRALERFNLIESQTDE